MRVTTAPPHCQQLGVSLGFSAYISASGDYAFQDAVQRSPSTPHAQQSIMVADFAPFCRDATANSLDCTRMQHAVVILSVSRSERGQLRLRERHGRCEAVIQRDADGVYHYFSVQQVSLDVGAGFMRMFYKYKSDAEDLLARCLFHNIQFRFGSADECGMFDGVLFTLPVKFEAHNGKSIILLFEKNAGRRLCHDLSNLLAQQRYALSPAIAIAETRRIFAFKAVLLGRHLRDVVLRVKLVAGAIFCSVSFQEQKKIFELSGVTYDLETTQSAGVPQGRARSATQKVQRMKALRLHSQRYTFALCFSREDYAEFCALLLLFEPAASRFRACYEGQNAGRAASAPPRRSNQ